jgi:hypothetical protein
MSVKESLKKFRKYAANERVLVQAASKVIDCPICGKKGMLLSQFSEILHKRKERLPSRRVKGATVLLNKTWRCKLK